MVFYISIENMRYNIIILLSEVEMIWEETQVACFSLLYEHSCAVTRKTTQTLSQDYVVL
jgi:hypothetical protein